jgi:hypothetical protein
MHPMELRRDLQSTCHFRARPGAYVSLREDALYDKEKVTCSERGSGMSRSGACM